MTSTETERESIHQYAARLAASYPDGLVLDQAKPLPDEAEFQARQHKRLPDAERDTLINAEITAFLALPDRHPRVLRDRLSTMDIGSTVTPLQVGDHDATDERLAEVGRWLVKHSTDRVSVIVGLALLHGRAASFDVPLLRPLFVLPPPVAVPAIRALASIPGATPHLIGVAERTSRLARNEAVAGLCRRGGAEAGDWLLRYGLTGPDDISTRNTQAVLDAVDLPTAIRGFAYDADLVRHTAWLLLASREPSGYADATDAYAAFADACGVLRAGLDDLALIARVAGDVLYRGAALLAWDDGERERVATRLLAAITAEDSALEQQPDEPGEHARWCWLRRTVTQMTRLLERGLARPFAIEVVVPDPVSRTDIQVRALAYGRPVLTERCDRTPRPEHLLGAEGPLSATEAPHDVELADHERGVGYCPPLSVTIERDGDTVRWRTSKPESLPDMAFDAAAYDEELAHAEADPSWIWSARTVAGLVERAITADPGPLERWQCSLAVVSARPWHRHQVAVTVVYSPPETAPQKLYFVRKFAVPDVPEPSPTALLEPLAEKIVRALTERHPKDTMTAVFGSPEPTTALGLTLPDRGPGR